MKNLATGEVAFGRAFSAAYIPPQAKYLAIFVVLLLIVLIVFVISRVGQKRRLLLRVEREKRANLAVANELRKGRDNLKRIQDSLTKIDPELALRVREQQNAMDKLLQAVELHPGIYPDKKINSSYWRDQERHNKFMLGLARNLASESENLLKHALSGSLSSVHSSLSDVDREIKNCQNKMYDNQAGRA